MKYHVLTTCNGVGWAQTGRRMAQSVMARWPAEALPLVVYAEGFVPDVDGVETRRLPEWLTGFKSWNGLHGRAVGQLRDGRYNYRFDAIKFAHKVAAVTDFGLSLDDGVMIWLDADTYTHADVTTDWLASLFPAPSYIAWIDRATSHPECGFVMYRCSHAFHHSFMKSFRDLYTSGDLFRLPGTNDCEALQHLVQKHHAAGKIEAPVSLSGDARAWHHPFVAGPIGARLDHMKGARKAEGRSRQRDLKTRRLEPYWNGR